MLRGVDDEVVDEFLPAGPISGRALGLLARAALELRQHLCYFEVLGRQYVENVRHRAAPSLGLIEQCATHSGDRKRAGGRFMQAGGTLRLLATQQKPCASQSRRRRSPTEAEATHACRRRRAADAIPAHATSAQSWGGQKLAGHAR